LPSSIWINVNRWCSKWYYYKTKKKEILNMIELTIHHLTPKITSFFFASSSS
jgi:hypothetical protein